MSEVTTEAHAENAGETTAQATVTDQVTGETVSETSYANGKYKSVSDLESGYMEAQKFISQKLGGFQGAPEEYTFDEGFEHNFVSEALTTWGKDNQLSQDGMQSLYDSIVSTETAKMEAYRKTQMEDLGANAETRIKNASDWVRANLGDDAVGAIDSMWVGAKGIETIEKIMKMASGIGTAPAPAQPTPAVDADKVRAMRFAENANGDRLMSIDPAYRAKVMALEAQLHGGVNSYIAES